jgi:arylsulfatase A-like enzyme
VNRVSTSSGLAAGAAAGLALGVVQALLETLVIAFLHADYVLAPRVFFNVRMYDAFSKLYTTAADAVGITVSTQGFLGVGFGAKFAMLPELLAVNAVVGVVVGALLGLLAVAVSALVSSARSSAGSSEDAAGTARSLVLVLALAALVLHALDWFAGVHFPIDPSFGEMLHNMARNFIFDGTVVAVCVVVVAVIPARMLAARLAAARQLPALACVLALAAGLWLGLRPAPYLAALPGGTITEAVPAPESAIAEGYNVVLVSIDSLRSDHLGAYGYDKNTSPTIDALARDGVLCEHNSSTTAWTLPGHMSILTGRSLLGHGVVADDRMLTDDVATLAESFSAAGYATGAVVSAPYVEARYGFGRGFDDYDDKTIAFATHGESYKRVTAPLLQDTAAEWLSDKADRNFFLFLHYWDVHYDYAPGPPYDSMFDPGYEGDMDGRNFYFDPRVNPDMDEADLDHVLALYDGEIRLVDDHLAKLRGTLNELGVADRTIIVVTSDHGDEFFEHGRKGHHRTLYDEILRVPLVIYVPGVKAVTPVLEMETSIIDIMPTLLSLVGLPIPVGVEGADLSGVGWSGDEQWDRLTLSELYRLNSLNCQVSLRRQGDKSIHHLNWRRHERYRTDIDPYELDRLPVEAGMMSELRSAMQRLWPVYWLRVAGEGVNELTVDDETEQRLRALGYME